MGWEESESGGLYLLRVRWRGGGPGVTQIPGPPVPEGRYYEWEVRAVYGLLVGDAAWWEASPQEEIGGYARGWLRVGGGGAPQRGEMVGSLVHRAGWGWQLRTDEALPPSWVKMLVKVEPERAR
jgi:hypothetical protein